MLFPRFSVVKHRPDIQGLARQRRWPAGWVEGWHRRKSQLGGGETRKTSRDETSEDAVEVSRMYVWSMYGVYLLYIIIKYI